MKLLIKLIILMATSLFSLQNVYGRDPNEPNTAQIQKNQSHCKIHSEIKARRSARCPVCGREIISERPLRRMMPCRRYPACGMQYPGMNRESANIYERRKNETGKLPKSENMLRKIMLNTPVDVFDPEVILGAEKPLELTEEQVNELNKINMTARQSAKKVLTDKQQSNLDSLAKSTNKIKTMAQMQHRIRRRMASSQGMMNPNVKIQKTETKDESPAKSSDPKPAGEITRTDLNLNSKIIPVRFDKRAEGDSGGRLRDNLRDRYRDYYRDQYRDRLRDNLRDRYYYNPYDYEYNPYDYGYYGYSPYYYEPYYGYNGFYDDENGYGDDEGFGDDEGGYGDDEGFGGDESGYGDDEGFGGDEGSIGDDEGFGGDEGSIGDDEGSSDDEDGGDDRR